MPITINGSGTITGASTLATTVVSPTLTTPIATTTMSVGNATPSASGAGISFPATQSASSDANTLDDYEEGTWTPTIGADGVDGTHTYSNQLGAYTKVGRLVTVQCFVAMATKGGTISGSVQIIGLPFSASGAAFIQTASVGYFTGLATNVVMLKAYINSSATRINMSKMAAAGANMTQMVAADVSATTALYVSASYFTT